MPNPIHIPNAPPPPGRDLPHTGGAAQAPLPPDIPQAVPAAPNSESGAGASMERYLQNPKSVQAFLARLDRGFKTSAELKARLTAILQRAVLDPRSLTPAAQRLAQQARSDAARLAENLRYELQNQTLFASPLFQALNEAVHGTPTPLVREKFAAFLKEFVAVQSRRERRRSLWLSLKDLEESLPKRFAERLARFNAELDPEDSEAALRQNLEMLKERIVPLLGEYSHVTGERGRVRDRIGHVIYLLAQLEASSTEKMFAAFDELLTALRAGRRITDAKAKLLTELLRRQTESGVRPENEFFEAFAETLAEAALPADPAKSSGREAVLASILADANVCMPFFHVILPVMYGDTAALCEVWVDKGGRNTSEEPFLLFLTFRIPGAGDFALRVTRQNAGYGVDVYCPEAWRRRFRELAGRVRDIFAENGLPPASVNCTDAPIPDVRRLIRKAAAERRSGIYAKI